jgi:hypothetical protein
LVLLSLAPGVVFDLAIGPWSGKLSGENALLRGLRNRLRRGNILRGDSDYSSDTELFREPALALIIMTPSAPTLAASM